MQGGSETIFTPICLDLLQPFRLSCLLCTGNWRYNTVIKFEGIKAFRVESKTLEISKYPMSEIRKWQVSC